MATALIDEPFGCSHYKRKCKLVAPCCNKIHTCRICHDEKENHSVNRKAIKEVICQFCNKKQKVRTSCFYCGVKFGAYTCLECNLFDDELKGQFHCIGCGICRVGGSQNFFHCPTCNLCLHTSLLGTHKCVENRSHTDCPVCLEDMHSSRIPLHFPDCGHLLHKPCFETLKSSGYPDCPICKKVFTNDNFKIFQH